MDDIANLGDFQPLFKKSVPHILERIFFSLDYDSFVSCQDVSQTWNELLASPTYQLKAEEMLVRKKENEEELCKYSEYGDADQVRRLLSKGVDKNCRGSHGGTPLYHAVKGYRCTEVVKILLDAGADPKISTNYGMTPLHWAAFQGNIEVVKLLLLAGADPHKAAYQGQGNTPLDLARKMNCHGDVYKVLLDADAGCGQ